MTIEELKEAHKNGATIQFRLDGKSWTYWENPKFDCMACEYRIKPKYRPFKDCDELIATWAKMMGYKAKENTMPLIWVRFKNNFEIYCVIGFSDKEVCFGDTWKNLEELFTETTFLDNSPCGVEL